MSILQVSSDLIVDNIRYFGYLFIIFLLIDILGWALLGHRK